MLKVNQILFYLVKKYEKHEFMLKFSEYKIRAKKSIRKMLKNEGFLLKSFKKLIYEKCL